MSPLELFFEIIINCLPKITLYTNEYSYKKFNEKVDCTEEDIL